MRIFCVLGLGLVFAASVVQAQTLGADDPLAQTDAGASAATICASGSSAPGVCAWTTLATRTHPNPNTQKIRMTALPFGSTETTTAVTSVKQMAIIACEFTLRRLG